ncbi:hypothetical protein [uncultured Methylobacterium sp.]|uniref:hypothetical protein n=1 Tax=uncultured Methylobacterium sp. TaxID=157278 RepID=UPI0035CAC3BE
MAQLPKASGDFWESLRALRRNAIFDADQSKPDAVVTAACRREAEALGSDHSIERVAHALEVEAHERGLLQRCPPLWDRK